MLYFNQNKKEKEKITCRTKDNVACPADDLAVTVASAESL